MQKAILELYLGGRDVGLADGWDLGCEGRKGRRKGATKNCSNISEDNGRHTRGKGGVGQLWCRRAATQTHCRETIKPIRLSYQKLGLGPLSKIPAYRGRVFWRPPVDKLIL